MRRRSPSKHKILVNYPFHANGMDGDIDIWIRFTFYPAYAGSYVDPPHGATIAADSVAYEDESRPMSLYWEERLFDFADDWLDSHFCDCMEIVESDLEYHD